MRAHVSTTDVRCVIANARGFRLKQRLARKNEHDGVIVRRGIHLLRHVSCLQTGEAEHYALIRGSCTLGIQPRLDDRCPPIDIYSDSAQQHGSVARTQVEGVSDTC